MLPEWLYILAPLLSGTSSIIALLYFVIEYGIPKVEKHRERIEGEI
jgi:hypothetical protein